MDIVKLREYVEIKKLLDEKDWWTFEELALYLDKSTKTIRNYTAGNKPKIDLDKCTRNINGTPYIIRVLFKEQFTKIEAVQ